MNIRSMPVCIAAAVVTIASLTSACSSDDQNEVVVTADTSALAAFVAEDRDMFDGVNVDVSTSGHDQAASLLITGDSQIAWMGPLEAAQYASEGEDFKYLSTAGALNMYNGVVVRAADASKYKSVNDLEGLKLGIPGFGTGTWADFAVFADLFYGIDDARQAFDTVTADSGALLALLEKGEIDAALLFAADSASARYSNKFETVFSFTDVMQDELGQPLAITGAVASQSWLDENPDEAEAIKQGLDDAVTWMREHPDAFDVGGEYEELAADDGWHSSPQATKGILKLLQQGEWFLSSDTYTPEWQNAIQQVVEGGEGTLVESVPAKDDYLAPVE